MAGWGEIEREAPEFARRARERFDAFRHKTVATLRKDGSPRISGIEVTFDDGDVQLGMMPRSLKALDLLRDPRLALHSGSADPDDEDPAGWAGDAKLSGRATPVTDRDMLGAMQAPPDPQGEPPHVFTVDVHEVVTVRVGEPPDHLVIESWREGEGLRTTKRY